MAIFLSKIYGDVKVQCGKKLQYLGMDLDYATPDEVKISIMFYVESIIKNIPEEIMGNVTTPTAEHLFEVQEEKSYATLPEQQAIYFHHNVAKLLFICNHARHDTQMHVAFLNNRVQQPDDDAWGKLKRVLKCLNVTMQLGLIQKADNIGIIKYYVDASCAIHNYCWGCTGAMRTFGQRAVASFSGKQKLNAKGSMEAQLIGLDYA